MLASTWRRVLFHSAPPNGGAFACGESGGRSGDVVPARSRVWLVFLRPDGPRSDEIDHASGIVYPFSMANDAKQYSATEETGAVSLPSAPTTSKEPPRSFLAVARRNLTAEELASPGTLRMLVAEIERLDVVCDQHETMVEKYHDQRVEIAALSEQSKTSKWHEILTVGAISIGSGLVGAAPSYFQIQGGGVIGGVVLAFGIALTVLGVVSKVMR